MRNPKWLESQINELLDSQQVVYLRIVLTKVRQHQKLSRREVAQRMGTEYQRVVDFEDGKQPWSSVALSFLQRYARAIGVKLEVGFIYYGPEEEPDASDAPDEGSADRRDPMDGGQPRGDTGEVP